MRGGHEHFVWLPSGCLGAVILVVIDGVLFRRGGIVLPGEGDGWTLGRGSIAKCYVVSSYFEGGEGDVSFHVVAGALGSVSGIVDISVSIIVAVEGVVGIVHAKSAGVGIQTRVDINAGAAIPRPSQVGTAETTGQPGRTAGTTAVDASIQRGLDLTRVFADADAAVSRSSQARTAEIAGKAVGAARTATSVDASIASARLRGLSLTHITVHSGTQ